MAVIGDKQKFAFATSACGQHSECELLTVDIYIAGKLVTVRDNTVYVPQFLGDVDATQRHMRNDLRWLQYRHELSGMSLAQAHVHLARTEGCLTFMNWGPTTDDVSSQLIVFQDSLWITAFLNSENVGFKNVDPVVFGSCISPFDLISTLERQCELMRGWADE